MPERRSEALNPNSVSKEMFIEELKRAAAIAGNSVGRSWSTAELGRFLGVHPRRIQYWINGRGPAYPTMQRIYAELLKLQTESE